MLLTKIAAAEQKALELVEMRQPKPKKGEILIRVCACGVCHTDLDEVEGRLAPPRLPVVLGHQVVGRVVDKGKEASRFGEGERVGVTWLYSSCGNCNFCRAGAENLCDEGRWTGLDVNGGYAEYMVVPEDFAYTIPEGFSDTQAAPLLCAGVIGYRALRLAGVSDGQIIGLFGFGASAHIVIQVIKHRYPRCEVFVFTRSKSHRQLAKKLGAAWVGSATDSPPAKVHRAIDFTPVGRSVRDGLAVLEKGGRLVINAIRKTTALPEMDYKYLWQERGVVSTANVTRQDALEFLSLAGKIPLKIEVEEFELAQANEVLLLLKEAKIRVAAVLKIGS
jgi:propanol-preferring alcohol dehydrogenase